jgi:aminoethylphosphonate catabolism LysR family transcriptional regulator
MLYTQLRSFHAVAREGSVTGAARILNVSQPTITTQVKELEARYGIELFHRRGRKLELTELGRELLQRTQHFFNAMDEVAELLEAAAGIRGGHLRIGAVGPFHVMKMISAFREHYPDIAISIDLGNTKEVVDGLRECRSDVAVVSQIEPDTDLLTIPFSQQRLVAFVGKDHHWSRRRSIALADLDGQEMVIREDGSTTRHALETALQEAGVTPCIVLEVGSREAVWESVAEGHGIGIVSEVAMLPDKRITALNIADAEIYTKTHVVCRKDRSGSRLIRAFLEVISTMKKPAAGC